MTFSVFEQWQRIEILSLKKDAKNTKNKMAHITQLPYREYYEALCDKQAKICSLIIIPIRAEPFSNLNQLVQWFMG